MVEGILVTEELIKLAEETAEDENSLQSNLQTVNECAQISK